MYHDKRLAPGGRTWIGDFKKQLHTITAQGQIDKINELFMGAEKTKRIKKVEQEFRHRYEESVTVRNQALKAYRKAKSQPVTVRHADY
jgi:hypothetical protein